MADIRLNESITGFIFENVTAWRNDDPKDNILTTIGKRAVTELTYVALPFLGMIEAVFRGIIALAFKGACYLVPEENKESIQKQFHLFLSGTVVSAAISGAAVIGIGHNITKEVVDPKEMLEVLFCNKA